MVAGQGIVRNYGRNNNSPATGQILHRIQADFLSRLREDNGLPVSGTNVSSALCMLEEVIGHVEQSIEKALALRSCGSGRTKSKPFERTENPCNLAHERKEVRHAAETG